MNLYNYSKNKFNTLFSWFNENPAPSILVLIPVSYFLGMIGAIALMWTTFIGSCIQFFRIWGFSSDGYDYSDIQYCERYEEPPVKYPPITCLRKIRGSPAIYRSNGRQIYLQRMAIPDKLEYYVE